MFSINFFNTAGKKQMIMLKSICAMFPDYADIYILHENMVQIHNKDN